MTDVTVETPVEIHAEIPETEAAAAGGRAPPTTAVAADPAATKAMSMPILRAEATATASAKIATQGASAEEATGAKGNGTATGAAGVDVTAVMTDGSVARSGI